MRAVLDACVLYPTVLREILLGVAAKGLYTPLWSDRILEEWARATDKLGPGAQVQARAEIALLRAAFPKACLPKVEAIERRLILPDPDDVHVLAGEGIERRYPDGFLWQLWSHHPGDVAAVVGQVHATAERISGGPLTLKGLMKRARLGRLGKALLAADQA